jgi:hypothetical protein
MVALNQDGVWRGLYDKSFVAASRRKTMLICMISGLVHRAYFPDHERLFRPRGADLVLGLLPS